MNIIKFKNSLNVSKIIDKNRFRKNKSVSISMFKMCGCVLASTIHIIFERTTKKDSLYISSYFTYKGYRISLNKKNIIVINKGNSLRNEIRNSLENKIRKVMIDNCNIKVKEISKIVNLSIYTVNKFYMKLRREQHARILK